MTKMKEMFEQRKHQENEFCEKNPDALEFVEKKYLCSCGGSISAPDEGKVLESIHITVGFDGEKDLGIRMTGNYCNETIRTPGEFVDEFFKLIANTKSQRDMVLKGIENLRNEEAED